MKNSIEDVCKSALQQCVQGLLVSAGSINANGLQASIEPNHNATNGLMVAYSGGLDSTVLLHIADKFCKQAKIPLTAVHVNHGLSDNAIDWQAHCQTQCAQRDIPFYTQSLSLKKNVQKSLEAEARDARYLVLDKFAGRDKIVLLAQHQNDQAETLLIQLKRGAGVKGLSAMGHSITRASGVRYLRPLLDVNRADILAYAIQHRLNWVEDESNQDNNYDRNFLRNKVLPILIERWPSFSKTVARSARHCAQANDVNIEYMRLLAERLIKKDCIDLLVLAEHSLATKECFLRYWLSSEYGLVPTSAQLSDLLRMTSVLKDKSLLKPKNAADNAPKNASPHIILANYVIERYQDKLTVKQNPPHMNAKLHINPTKIEWNSESIVTLNDSYTLHKVPASSASKPKVFELPEKGVEFVFGGSSLEFKYKINRPTKPLKAWYQEWDVSPMDRQQTPVFIWNGKAIVVGLEALRISCINSEKAIYVELCKSVPI